MVNQEIKRYRVLSLPSSGLISGSNYELYLGGGQYRNYVVNDSNQLIAQDSKEFIECNTVDDLRNLDARQIWAIQNGYYKGVTLNGYYEKGDTPAPIQYYLSDTTEPEDGGSIFEVGGIKLEHEFLGEVNINYFGALENLSIFSAFTNCRNHLTKNGGGTILIEGNKSYIVDSTLTLTDNITLNGLGGVVTFIAQGVNTVISCPLKEDLPIVVTSSIKSGQRFIEGTFEGVEVGDIIRIRSSEIFTRRWNPNIERAYYLDGELVEVESVESDRVTLTTAFVLDYDLDKITDSTFFKPSRNISVDNIRLVGVKSTTGQTRGLHILNTSNFRCGKIITENFNWAGVYINKAYNTEISDFQGIGGTPDLELNYGIQVANGSKFTSVLKTYGDYFRHIISGGGDGYAISMYATFNLVEAKSSYNSSIDAHSNTGYFTFNTVNVDKGPTVSGLGHYMGRVDADFNMYAGIGFGGGKDMYIGTLSIKNSWIFYREAPIIDSYFGKIKINVNRDDMTTTSPHVFRTLTSDSFRIGCLEINNSNFDSNSSGDDNLSLLKGANQAIFTTRENMVIDSLIIRGFPQPLAVTGKNSTIKKLLLENCGWLGTEGTARNIVSFGTSSTNNSIHDVLIRNTSTSVSWDRTNLINFGQSLNNKLIGLSYEGVDAYLRNYQIVNTALRMEMRSVNIPHSKTNSVNIPADALIENCSDLTDTNSYKYLDRSRAMVAGVGNTVDFNNIDLRNSGTYRADSPNAPDISTSSGVFWNVTVMYLTTGQTAKIQFAIPATTSNLPMCYRYYNGTTWSSWVYISDSARPGTISRPGSINRVASSPDTATQASGETPTKAEFDALLAELRDLKTKMRAGDAPILSS